MVNGQRRLFLLFLLILLVVTMITLNHYKFTDANFNGSPVRKTLLSNVELLLFKNGGDRWPPLRSEQRQRQRPEQQLTNLDDNKPAVIKSNAKVNATQSSSMNPLFLVGSKNQPENVQKEILYDSSQDSVSPLTTSETLEVPSNVKKVDLSTNSWNLSKDMLEDTKTFVIAKDNYCDDYGVATDLIIMVTSAVNNLAQRDAIRQTWGQFAVERGALLLFLLGKSVNKSVQNAVLKEELMNGDLLQTSFVDSYFNLTLKSIAMMRWIKDNCSKVKFVFKVDDDMFVNMQLLVDFSETRSFTKSIIGRIARRWQPQRRKTSKWFLPRAVYNRSTFPDFATGPAYMFTGDAAGPLLDESLKQTPIYLEDVYITGIVAEKAKIKRLNYSLMKNSRINVTPCSFRRFITSHQHAPKDILRLWKLVYSNSSIDCSKTTASVKVTRNEKKSR